MVEDCPFSASFNDQVRFDGRWTEEILRVFGGNCCAYPASFAGSDGVIECDDPYSVDLPVNYIRELVGVLHGRTIEIQRAGKSFSKYVKTEGGGNVSYLDRSIAIPKPCGGERHEDERE